MYALPPPIRLLMSDGRVEEIQVPDEDDLAFIRRVSHSPLSREADLICDAVGILQQPGHLIEMLQGMLPHSRDIMRGAITPEPVKLGLCTREQYCGIEPQSVEDLEARKRVLFQNNEFTIEDDQDD
jgi:hypothetical protein